MRRSLLLSTIVAWAAVASVGAADAPNTLTPKEKSDGWMLLFDGTTTKGWHGYNRQGVPAGWEAKDGALTRVSKSVDLVTDSEYGNFDLLFDWKIAANGNSGLMFHVVESPKYAESYFTGPEFQLLDNLGHPDGKNGKDRWAGANYALHAPSQDTTRPVGEWNACRLVVNKGHVAHDFKIGGKKTALVKPGKSAKLTVTLKAGKIAYLCTVAGHAAAGMKGKLTVR